MRYLNVEIKARCADPGHIRDALKSLRADFKGCDCQTDTYFKVPFGRLKLREGEIENCLVHYAREDVRGPRESQVLLCRTVSDPALKEILSGALGVLAVVKKAREIYFVGNVKFHIDRVESLGDFVEIEAIDREGNLGKTKLLEQCRAFMELFRILPADLEAQSYSDMLIGNPARAAGVANEADDWIRRLGLLAHPEGGYYRETYRSRERIEKDRLPTPFEGSRSVSTAIYFLLEPGQVSRFHRLKADEVWHFYAGSPLRIYILWPDGRLTATLLGSRTEEGQAPQAVVPSGLWFGAEPVLAGSYSLVGCTVAPGFDFSDFEMGSRRDLIRTYPDHRAIIEKLTSP